MKQVAHFNNSMNKIYNYTLKNRTFTLKKLCIYFVFTLLFLFSISLLISCRKGSYRELDKLIVSLASEDKVIDVNDWKEITTLIENNKEEMSDFYEDDKLKENAVIDYITNLLQNRRPAVAVSFIGVGNAKDLSIKLYLERSGSMVAYDAPQGDGSFKAALVQLLNSLPTKQSSNKLYVVNSSINEYPNGFDKFLSDTNIFDATKGLGDPSYTDFRAIFNTILQQTKQNELSILVTDMIYSTKDMAGINPQKVFAEAQGMTQAVFNDVVKSKSMLVIRLQSSYNGQYYTYKSPTIGVKYNGKRPYYIVIVGDNNVMKRLTADANYRSFATFTNLKGYQQTYLFATSSLYQPFYSLLLNNPSIRGRFRPERGEERTITKIEDVEVDENSGELQLALAVNLKDMLIDPSYATDKNNYEIISDDKIVLKSIKPLKVSDLSSAEKRYASYATHLFILTCKGITHDQKVKIRLLNNLPNWVEQASNDNDEVVDANTTFGLKYLLQGIYNGYKKNTNGVPSYFDLDLNIKK